ncbi:hypothetical protein I9018_31300 [Pseudomonas sp. MPFS]|uniref:cupin domain-containing protein n=1 Tax=Pseudomonas sp. MPFS TaxID=2795724 RepID=UPI001F12DA5E|nr:cupin domain-containing protein [Pseudomonas sp. MPFS]UMZ11903.1 hypothetical protein I9018_31300 [Pseudomonas sp. MPFS]
MNLLELVAPLSRAEFIQDFFEKKPYISKRNALCKSLNWINKEWLSSTLKDKEFPVPILDMADGTRRIDKNKYTKLIKVGSDTVRLPDSSRLFKLHDSKRISLILQAVEQWNPEVAVIAQHLVKNCYGYIGANLYCTPQNARTFPKHFDTHEVFIAQTQGQKTWNIWRPGYQNPRRGDKFSGDRDTPPDYIFVVEEGDILYIPRGFPHEAVTTDCLSIHLTFGLSLLNVSDVLDFAASHNDGSVLRAGLLLDGSSELGARENSEALSLLHSVLKPEFFKLATFAVSLEKFGVQQHIQDSKFNKKRLVKGSTKYKVSFRNFRYFYCDSSDRLTVASPGGVLELEGGISAALACSFSTYKREIDFFPDQLTELSLKSLDELVRMGVLSMEGEYASCS